MRIEDIEIHVGTPTFEFTPVRQLEAKCEAATAISSAPTMDEMNGKLRQMAAKVGANAVINVEYKSGVSMTSWRSMKGTGLAVMKQSDDATCPSCAETIKRAAVKCRFCGADVESAAKLAEPAQASSEPSSIVRAAPAAANAYANQEPLRETNNPQWWLIAIGAFVVLSTCVAISS